LQLADGGHGACSTPRLRAWAVWRAMRRVTSAAGGRSVPPLATRVGRTRYSEG
jgi:hypothetical protein